MEIKRVISQIWELYNENSVNGILIISREKFTKELKRIEIQNS